MFGDSFILVGIDPLEGDNGRQAVRKTRWLLTAPSPPPSPPHRAETHFSSHLGGGAGPVLSSKPCLAPSIPPGLGSAEAAPS